MKKVSILISITIIALFINNATVKAQAVKTGEKHFTGKWSLMVYGLPDGDTKLIMNIETKDDKLTGNLTDPGKSDAPMELENIEVADSTFKASFPAQGMDITLFLKLKDAKNVSGNMMDMFEIKGTKEE